MMPVGCLPKAGTKGGSVIASMTNAQKLALPLNTPVGTRVRVTDMLNIIQELQAPSVVAAGMTVAGIDPATGGVFVNRAAVNGKSAYQQLGTAQSDATLSSLTWSDLGGGTRWNITDPTGFVFYYSPDNVATPNLATDWFYFDGDAPTAAIVLPVLQGALDAGVLVSGAGTSADNGAFVVNGNENGRTRYGGNDGTRYRTTPGWTVGGSDIGFDYIADGDDAFPFGLTYVVGGGSGTPPAPTVVRNNVASEANWETV